MSSIAELQERAENVRRLYDALNIRDGHQKWGGKEYAMGFVGDVGDLMKLVMAKEGLRRGDDIDAKLQHELSDCLWAILVLAEHYKIDIAAVFNQAMNDLEVRIAEEMK
jgi:NTP pyrophosphatase (non-canonical NTP hydrolase)